MGRIIAAAAARHLTPVSLEVRSNEWLLPLSLVSYLQMLHTFLLRVCNAHAVRGKICRDRR